MEYDCSVTPIELLREDRLKTPFRSMESVKGWESGQKLVLDKSIILY